MSNNPLKLSRVLRGHHGYIFRMSWSPDGHYISTPSQDKRVIIWEPSSGRIVREFLGHNNEVNSTAWSHDGKLIASCGDDYKVIVWSLASGDILNEWEMHTDEVNDVSWSPCGKYLASVSDDKKVIIYNIDNPRDYKRLHGHTQTIWSVEWSYDGRWVATGSDDETIRLWDISSGEQRILYGHESTVRSIAWLPDSQNIISGSRDKTIRFWSIHESESLSVIPAHDAIITSVKISRSGEFFASKSHDGTVKIWDVESKKCTYELKENATDRWSLGIAFNPQSDQLATLGEKSDIVRIWDIDSRLLKNNINIRNDECSTIFISYCHKDAEWLEKIVSMLRPIVREKKIVVFVDKDLKPGIKWRDEIIDALQNSDIAILLVTPNYTASNFILEIELPKLLDQAGLNKLKIMWIPISSAPYKEVGLSEYQAGCDPLKPLDTLPTNKRNALLLKICRELVSLIDD
jgi:WD40 repeat protein